MKLSTAFYEVNGIVGLCGQREVFTGFASAGKLYAASFADVLDEETGEGYQRPRNKRHSVGFKNFISRPNSTTIPLTFNLREEWSAHWSLERHEDSTATLCLSVSEKCMAQVDCQHRLGELQDSDVSLAFMTFIGLSLRDEMSIFNVINRKAKGLSSSLTDYHESQLAENLKQDDPHLYIALRLNEDRKSPWYKLIKYGGKNTSGLKRRTSLRMMQKSVRKLLGQAPHLRSDPDVAYVLISDFWRAVAAVFPDEWSDHRHHLISKGIGLYALMGVLGDIVNSTPVDNLTAENCACRLRDLTGKIDWGTNGTFSNAGGQKGVKEAHAALRGVLEL